MTKLKDGIEVGEFQTSGADNDLQQDEMKERGGRGSAKSNMFAHPRTNYAHKQPVTEGR